MNIIQENKKTMAEQPSVQHPADFLVGGSIVRASMRSGGRRYHRDQRSACGDGLNSLGVHRFTSTG
jgi:hypothetical protein